MAVESNTKEASSMGFGREQTSRTKVNSLRQSGGFLLLTINLAIHDSQIDNLRSLAQNKILQPPQYFKSETVPKQA